MCIVYKVRAMILWKKNIRTNTNRRSSLEVFIQFQTVVNFSKLPLSWQFFKVWVVSCLGELY